MSLHMGGRASRGARRVASSSLAAHFLRRGSFAVPCSRFGSIFPPAKVPGSVAIMQPRVRHYVWIDQETQGQLNGASP